MSGPPFGENLLTSAGLVDHSATAISRLAEVIKTQPNFLALLASLVTQVQDLETALQQLNTLRGLPTATGGQLDVIGEILTQPRAGLSDGDYRDFLSARILLNQSSGTVDQILTIFALVTTGTLTLTEWPPAAFELQLQGQALTADTLAVLLAILRQARAAGVKGELHWTAYPEADTFTLDGTPAQSLDAGHLTGISL